MKIPRLSITNEAVLMTLFIADSVSAHSAGGHSHSWYALDHIMISLGICALIFLLYKIFLFFAKKVTSSRSKNRSDASEKTSAYK